MSVIPDDPGTVALAEPELHAPRSKTELFVAFTWLALQGFGGVLAVSQRELVERLRWLNKEQFIELLSLSQVLPGPNIVNLSLMFGDRHFGWRGALVAVGGMLAAPLVIVLALAALYAQFSAVPQVAGALRGMGAVASGLILGTAFKLVPTLKRNPMGVWPSAAIGLACALALGWLRWPLVWVVLVLGASGFAWAWHRLSAQRSLTR
jgi:chromate transporter